MSLIDGSLTVAICTTGRRTELRRCLDGLQSQTDPPEQVLIVWSGYVVPPAIDAYEHIEISSIAVARPGLSLARNAALHTATGAVVAFIDDDAVPEPHWCEAVRRCFSDAAVGGASGPVLPLEGVAANVPLLAANANFDSPCTLSADDAEWFAQVHFGGFVSGANMAVRRDVVQKGFRFHPALGLGAAIQGGEEQYAFHQIIELGFTLRYDPQAAVRHALPAGEEQIALKAFARQRNGVAYIGFLFVSNATARRYLPGWLVRKTSRKGRAFAGVSKSRSLRYRARLKGVTDLLAWMIQPAKAD